MRQRLKALIVPNKTAIGGYLDDMRYAAVFSNKAAAGLEGGAQDVAQGRAVQALALSPPWCFDCCSQAKIWIRSPRLICFGGGLPIKTRQ